MLHGERTALSADDVAAMLHVSKSGIYGLIKNGEIDFYKVGRKIRFTETNVRDYIEKSKTSVRATHPGGADRTGR